MVYMRLSKEEDMTVAYLRLSKEDGDDESVSISNQRRILEEYARNNNIIINEWYIDDGYSGYTMSRPSFNRLKEDLNNNKIKTIIVKDLSRLGRHNAKVQLFLENIYEVGKRVISLGDNYDSFNENSHKFVGIQAWMNENFIRETSAKIRDSVKSLQKEGKWLCSVPYGYIKDEKDKYKYHVDTTVAHYVQQIFDMYIDGMGLKMIAKVLTDNNVPTPSMVKKMQTKNEAYKKYVTTNWDACVISKMLQNPFYIGTLTLGKSKRRAINGRSIATPEEDWYIFPNHHEPIIDKQTFVLVQEIKKSRSFGDYRGKKIQTRPNIFAGLLYCADCGKTLTSNQGKPGNTRYLCRTYNTYGTSQCTSHAVSEKEVKYALLGFLEDCKENLSNIISDLDNIIQAQLNKKSDSGTNISQLTSKIQDTKDDIKILIEQKTREMKKNLSAIDTINEMYDELLNEKYKEVQILEKQLTDQCNIQLDEIELKKNLNSAMSIMNEVLLSKELTKKQVMLLVDKIVVHEDTGIDIYLKGDLHKICNNYFRVSESKKDTIKRLTYGFIMQSPQKFTTNDGAIYIRNNGVKIAYKTFSKLLKEELLADGLIKVRPMNHGYELVATPEELKARLIPNIDVDISRWLCNNNEIFAVLKAINEWMDRIKYEGQKNLF